jgi:hypothetical protein
VLLRKVSLSTGFRRRDDLRKAPSEEEEGGISPFGDDVGEEVEKREWPPSGEENGLFMAKGDRKEASGPLLVEGRWSSMSAGKEGNWVGRFSGRLSMKDRTSVIGSVLVGATSLKSMKSKEDGTVEGASSCSSRLEVTNEFQTSALNAPSE